MFIKKKTIKFFKDAFWWLQISSNSNERNIEINYEDFLKIGDIILPTPEEKSININNKKILLKEEYFESIDAFLKAVLSREKNPVMRKNDSSQTNSFEFTKTNSFEESVMIYQKGYYEPLEEIKKGIEGNITNYNLDDFEKSRVINSVVGFVPNIPNTLMNLPESMIHRNMIIQKTRTIYIKLYNSVESSISASRIIKAGIALLTCIKLLERKRISIRLDISLYSGGEKTSSDSIEIVAGLVRLKDYTESLDLLKLCFPIVHPSSLRRFGFKYLETFPEEINYKFSNGYGIPLNRLIYPDELETDNNTIVFFTGQIIGSFNNNPKTLLNYINSKCQIL